MLECCMSKAASHPWESPQVTLSARFIVLFLASLNLVCVVGVTSFGTLNVALVGVLEETVPTSPLTLIIAPSPILLPVTVI